MCTASISGMIMIMYVYVWMYIHVHAGTRTAGQAVVQGKEHWEKTGIRVPLIPVCARRQPQQGKHTQDSPAYFKESAIDH